MLIYDRRIRRYFWPGMMGITLIYLLHRVLHRPISSQEESRPMASVIIPAKMAGPAINDDDNGRIPRIIHQTWKTHHVPEIMGKWAKTWLSVNTDWEYWFWTDHDILQFIEAKFPQYLDLFKSYPSDAYRADAFRYFVLYEYGGVYADLDMEAVKPITDIMRLYKCVLSQEPQEHAHFLSPLGVPLVSNALMACRPGHPFFEHIIADLNDYAGLFEWNEILKATGPYMLTEVYRGYSRPGLIFTAPSGDAVVDLAEPEIFQPTTDQSMRDHIREACIHSKGHSFLSGKYLVWQEKLCTNILQNGFRESPAENSVTDHHWTHTWGGRKADPWNILGNPRTFDVRKLRNERT